MLTINELKSLEPGDWIYLKRMKQPKLSGYRTRISFTKKMFCVMDFDHRWNTLNIKDYGRTWLVYRNKEEAEGKSITLPCLHDISAVSVREGKEVRSKELNYMLSNGSICSEIYSEDEYDIAEAKLKEIKKGVIWKD